MEIQRIGDALVRIPGSTDAGRLPLQLAPGDRLAARVAAQLPDGRLQLELKGQTVDARTSVALAAGQVIDVEVAGVGAEVLLRVVGGAPVVSEQALALGVLAAAGRPGTAQVPVDAGVLLRALDAEVVDLEPQQRADFLRLLAPVRAGDPPDALAGAIRHVLENGGLLFESRLRAWLGQAPAGASPGTASPALPPGVASDIKVLLGLLGRALGTSSPVSTGGPGLLGPAPAEAPADALLDQAAELLDRELATIGGSDRAARESLRLEHGRLRDEVLARQVETAFHWVRDGTLDVRLPLAFADGSTTARLRFLRGVGERDAGGRNRPTGDFSFDFALRLPDLGEIRARVTWFSRQLQVGFFVERPDTAALVSANLTSLTRALERTGFDRVAAEVTVDATRCRLDELDSPGPPSRGSILDVRT
jgi:hypothetical protein